MFILVLEQLVFWDQPELIVFLLCQLVFLWFARVSIGLPSGLPVSASSFALQKLYKQVNRRLISFGILKILFAENDPHNKPGNRRPMPLGWYFTFSQELNCPALQIDNLVCASFEWYAILRLWSVCTLCPPHAICPYLQGPGCQLFMVCTFEWNAHQLLAPSSTKGLMVIRKATKGGKTTKSRRMRLFPPLLSNQPPPYC